MASEFTRRRVVQTGMGLAGAGLAGCLGLGGGGDGDYPSETITLVVPFGAGGLMDRNVRGFKPAFDEALPVSTTVDNRGGGGGRPGTSYGYQQEADGYTLIANDPGALTMGDVLFDVEYSYEDITAISVVQSGYNGLASQEETLDDFVTWAEGADRVRCGVAHTGTSAHLRGIVTLDGVGVDLDKVTWVPNSGGSPDIAADIARGDVDVGVVGSTRGLQNILNDRGLSMIFVNRPDQDPLYPDVPTIEDYPDVPLVPFSLSLFAPPDLADDRIETINGYVEDAVEDPDYQEWAEQQSVYPLPFGTGSGPVRDLMENIVDLTNQHQDLLQG